MPSSLKDWLNGKRKTFSLGQHELLDPVLDIQGKEYSTGSTRARAFLCLLATRKPRYLDTGLEIPLAQAPVVESNSKHRHHIFPKAQLSRHFSIKDRNSLCNICFLVAKDNREISFRRPAAYLSDFRARNKKHFAQIMKSHLIPVSEDSGVWDRGIKASFKKFRSRRLTAICSALELEAGMKLFKQS